MQRDVRGFSREVADYGRNGLGPMLIASSSDMADRYLAISNATAGLTKGASRMRLCLLAAGCCRQAFDRHDIIVILITSNDVASIAAPNLLSPRRPLNRLFSHSPLSRLACMYPQVFRNRCSRTSTLRSRS